MKKKDLFGLAASSGICFPTYPVTLKPLTNLNLVLQLQKGQQTSKL